MLPHLCTDDPPTCHAVIDKGMFLSQTLAWMPPWQLDRETRLSLCAQQWHKLLTPPLSYSAARDFICLGGVFGWWLNIVQFAVLYSRSMCASVCVGMCECASVCVGVCECVCGYAHVCVSVCRHVHACMHMSVNENELCTYGYIHIIFALERSNKHSHTIFPLRKAQL